MKTSKHCKDCVYYRQYDATERHNAYGYCEIMRNRFASILGEHFQSNGGFRASWADVSKTGTCEDFERRTEDER